MPQLILAEVELQVNQRMLDITKPLVVRQEKQAGELQEVQKLQKIIKNEIQEIERKIKKQNKDFDKIDKVQDQFKEFNQKLDEHEGKNEEVEKRHDLLISVNAK